MTTRLEKPTLDAVRGARERIADAVVHTPLVPATRGLRSPDVWLKLETFQPITSFKIRGVFHAVHRLGPDRREAGLLTVSAGNTAQALAWTGGYFGVPVECIMPRGAPAAKIRAVEALGGRVRLVDTDELFGFLQNRGWESEPAAFIHPWIEPDVLLGHASLGLELVEDLETLQSVFVPVGGGGLIAGVAGALDALGARVRVYAVEPEQCCALHQSLRADRALATSCKTMCDGVAVPYLTEEMFPLLRELVDTTVQVSEEEVMRAVRDLAVHQKIVVEPSGALALAAARTVPVEERGASVCVVSGGSIDPELLSGILADRTEMA